jgi:hypothetical protein
MKYAILLIISLSILCLTFSFETINFDLIVIDTLADCTKVTFTRYIIAVYCPAPKEVLSENEYYYDRTLLAHVAPYHKIIFILLESHFDKTHLVHFTLLSGNHELQLGPLPSIEERLDFLNFIKTEPTLKALLQYRLYDITLRKHHLGFRSKYLSIGLNGVYYDTKVSFGEKVVGSSKIIIYDIGQDEYKTKMARTYDITLAVSNDKVTKIRCVIGFSKPFKETLTFEGNELENIGDLDTFRRVYWRHLYEHVFKRIKVEKIK